MKKSYLLLLLPTLLFADVTGEIEAYSNLESNVYKEANFLQDSDLTSGIKFKASVENTGFSFGGKLQMKSRLEHFPKGMVEDEDDPFGHSLKVAMDLDGSKIWAKYAFPEFYKTHTYIKGQVDADKNSSLELDVQNFALPVELGFNFKSNMTLAEKTFTYFTVKGFVQKAKLSKFRDIRLDFGTQYRIRSHVSAFSSFNAELSTRVDLIDGLKLYAETSVFKAFDPFTVVDGHDPAKELLSGHHHHHGEGHDHSHDHDHDHDDEEDEHGHGHEGHSHERGFGHIHGYKHENEGLEHELDVANIKSDPSTRTFIDLANSNLLALKYDGIKGLDITQKVKVYYNHIDVYDINDVMFFASNKISYEPIEHLNLSNLLEFAIYPIHRRTNEDPIPYDIKNTTKFKYDYAPNKKFVVSPEVKLEISNNFGNKHYFMKMFLTPKLEFKYMPLDDLTLSAYITTSDLKFYIRKDEEKKVNNEEGSTTTSGTQEQKVKPSKVLFLQSPPVQLKAGLKIKYAW